MCVCVRVCVVGACRRECVGTSVGDRSVDAGLDGAGVLVWEIGACGLVTRGSMVPGRWCGNRWCGSDWLRVDRCVGSGTGKLGCTGKVSHGRYGEVPWEVIRLGGGLKGGGWRGYVR